MLARQNSKRDDAGEEKKKKKKHENYSIWYFNNDLQQDFRVLFYFLPILSEHTPWLYVSAYTNRSFRSQWTVYYVTAKCLNFVAHVHRWRIIFFDRNEQGRMPHGCEGHLPIFFTTGFRLISPISLYVYYSMKVYKLVNVAVVTFKKKNLYFGEYKIQLTILQPHTLYSLQYSELRGNEAGSATAMK